MIDQYNYSASNFHKRSSCPSRHYNNTTINELRISSKLRQLSDAAVAHTRERGGWGGWGVERKIHIYLLLTGVSLKTRTM